MTYQSKCSAGLIVDTVDHIAQAYLDTKMFTYFFEVSKMAHWRQLYTLGKHIDGMIVSLTGNANPYLGAIKDRYDIPIIGIRFSPWDTQFDYDVVYESWEIGWGVDKKRYADITANRRPKSTPAFHMLSPDEEIESALIEWGYKVHSGTSYHLGDVALEPRPVVVPTAMYEAAASGMPVVSIRENEHWTDELGVFEGLFLDDLLVDVVDEVCRSDFLYAGMIASDMVPSLQEFRESVRALLKHLRTD